MAQQQRNARCYCGSGKKYKMCCRTKDDLLVASASETTELVEFIAPEDKTSECYHEYLDWRYSDIKVLIGDKNLRAAETATRKLLDDHPDETVGWDCLALIHEQRGEKLQARACYHEILAMMDARPADFDIYIREEYEDRIAELDLPAQPTGL
jgi:Flp pilus assembly protein TadD